MGCCCERHTSLTNDKAPAAIGPYSIGVQVGDLVFSSGQLGIDPASGKIVEGGIEAETHQALRNLAAVLEAAGAGLEDIVKTSVFLRDINDFAAMNTVYAGYFKENPPARSAFQVAALPKGAAIEIEAIAVLPVECDCEEGECDCEEGECNCDCDSHKE
jgi:2-iminobutanoate/2-iminopropanoate deaminase